ncbi:MAG: YggT family protein [Dehalococcoidia bacterium]
MNPLVAFINLLATILYIAIFARIILSWFQLGGVNNPLVTIVYQLTEPILAPLRRIIPRVGMFDLTPMIAIIIIGMVQSAVNRL